MTTRKHKPLAAASKKRPSSERKSVKAAPTSKKVAASREKERPKAAATKKAAEPVHAAAPAKAAPPAKAAAADGKKGTGIGPRPSVMPEDRQSQLKLLIARGKEQGYLTYAQVNDHLPSEIV